MGLAARLLPAGGCESDWVSHCRVPPALAATACEAVITDAAIRTSVNLSLAVLRFFVPVSADDAHGPQVSITGNLAFQSNTMPLVHPVIATVTVLFHSADTSHYFHRGIPLTLCLNYLG